MKLVNMKMSKEEKREQSSMVGGGKPPEYPYGLCISLDDDGITKLKMNKPKVGDKIMFIADAIVTRVSESEEEGGDAERSVSLQITDMVIDSDSEEVDRGKQIADKLYK